MNKTATPKEPEQLELLDPTLDNEGKLGPINSKLSPAVSELPEKNFSTILQGKGPNALTGIRAVEGKNTEIDELTGEATIRNGDLTVRIPNFRELAGLRTSTLQLLDAITISLTESGSRSPTVSLSLDNYMDRRGLKDRKEAKKQVREDIETLSGISLKWTEERGDKVETFSFINLADSGRVERNGDIIFTFGTTFYHTLKGYPVMAYPKQLQTLNAKRNPNSYHLLKKISELKNMNVGKKNENIVAVETLLSVASYLPSYEEVMRGNRNVQARIIEPFERDMDALGDTLTWEYCHSLGQPLTDEELTNISYDIFEKLLIKITWREYPDQTARLQTKAERIKKGQKKKKTKKAN